MAGVKAPSKTCQLFQLMCWPQGYKVPTSTNALVELMNMVERWRQRTDYGPVVVVSQDGIGRSGVYCAANACIEQVIQHGEVDVFQAVKTVRRHRPQLVQNLVSTLHITHYTLHITHYECSGREETNITFRLNTSTAMIWSFTTSSTIFTKNNQNKPVGVDISI